VRYAAFLRGINLGKARRVKNTDLAACFEAAGLEEVGTFRASGNVIFSAPGRQSEAKLKARVEEALESALGYEVTTFLRSEDEVRAIAALDPFPPELIEASNGKLQVDMLEGTPSASVREEVLAHASDQDRLAFGERELYWLPSGGYLESELDLKAIEKLVGRTTRRTMGTVEQIASKYFSG
jgi:uncharacterized protein (DUF1697 family)